MAEADIDELALGIETPVAIAGEIAGLEAEIGDGQGAVALQREADAGAGRRVGRLAPFEDVDRRRCPRQVEIGRDVLRPAAWIRIDEIDMQRSVHDLAIVESQTGQGIGAGIGSHRDAVAILLL